MSPVVIVGFGALDAAVVSQALYALRDFRRAEARAAERALRRRR